MLSLFNDDDFFLFRLENSQMKCSLFLFFSSYLTLGVSLCVHSYMLVFLLYLFEWTRHLSIRIYVQERSLRNSANYFFFFLTFEICLFVHFFGSSDVFFFLSSLLAALFFSACVWMENKIENVSYSTTSALSERISQLCCEHTMKCGENSDAYGLWRLVRHHWTSTESHLHQTWLRAYGCGGCGRERFTLQEQSKREKAENLFILDKRVFVCSTVKEVRRDVEDITHSSCCFVLDLSSHLLDVLLDLLGMKYDQTMH